MIFVDMPSEDPVAASRFYAKVFGWTDDARLPGVFHRLNPGGCIRGPDGVETKVANLHFGASKAPIGGPIPSGRAPTPGLWPDLARSLASGSWSARANPRR